MINLQPLWDTCKILLIRGINTFNQKHEFVQLHHILQLFFVSFCVYYFTVPVPLNYFVEITSKKQSKMRVPVGGFNVIF